jgi:CRISPR-associated protein Csb2
MDANGWQIGSGAHDLLRLLALHPQGTAATIKQRDERERPFQFGNRYFRSLQFQTVRHDGGGNRGNSSGNAFIITFPEPVSGPFALGYGSHFGLGLFQPIMSLEAAPLDESDSAASIRNPSQL